MSTASRRDIIDQALHNTRLSGLEPSDELKADMEAWINEDISVEEMIQRALDRYKK